MFRFPAGPGFQDNPSKGCFPPAVIPVVESSNGGTEIAGFWEQVLAEAGGQKAGVTVVKALWLQGQESF